MRARTLRFAALGVAAALVLGATITAVVHGEGGGSSPSPAATATPSDPGTKLGDLVISNVRVTSTVNDVSSLYFSVKNNGSAADDLIGAAVDPAVADKATLHTTVTQGAVSQMQLIDHAAVPPGGTLEFSPGGNHVMLEGVKTQLTVGQAVSVELRFAKAGSVKLTAPVKTPGE